MAFPARSRYVARSATRADQAHRVHGPDLAASPAVPSGVSIA